VVLKVGAGLEDFDGLFATKVRWGKYFKIVLSK
jgi:hypothetical protein